ncbi:MAG: M17 family peptidase N-terminal domain-containing protein, partial [Gemmatimonadota bacterium]|nr:M17 family peptidase N-terminal domain-containing protein [Gemmatimonadota bacterium]
MTALALRAGDPATLRAPLLAVALPQGTALPRALGALDRATGGVLTRALRSGDFRGDRDETLLLYGRGKGPERVLLVGAGAQLTPAAIWRAATL